MSARSIESGMDGSASDACSRSISMPEKTIFMIGVWASGTVWTDEELRSQRPPHPGKHRSRRARMRARGPSTHLELCDLGPRQEHLVQVVEKVVAVHMPWHEHERVNVGALLMHAQPV